AGGYGMEWMNSGAAPSPHVGGREGSRVPAVQAVLVGYRGYEARPPSKRGCEDKRAAVWLVPCPR
nr:hypothetical protein [Pirellula sp.]